MKNEYGLDADYFRKLIKREFGDISRFKPDEFARVCLRMSKTADSSVIDEPEFAKNTDLQAKNDELRAKLKIMTKLGSDMADELQANHNNQQTRLMSMKWYKTVDSSNAQSLADIRAEAVMSMFNHCKQELNHDHGQYTDCVVFEGDAIKYANKIKGAE